MASWSCKLSEGNPYTLTKGYDNMFLNITNAILTNNSKPGKSYLMITKGVETFTVGMLKKDQVVQLRLDLAVTKEENIRLSLSGPGEVKLLGNFEKYV